MPEYAWNALRIASRQYARRHIDLHLTGEEHLPAKGPAIIAARHYHHLIDGVAMMMTVPHPMHILVGLDWIRNPAGKVAMQKMCDAAGWPVVLRRDGASPVDDADAQRALRTAYRQSLKILRQGHSLLIFPEGYPTIDPGYTPKTSPDEFLPFQPGFAQLAKGAARLGIAAPIIPAGFAYRDGERWDVTLAFGEPVWSSSYPRTDELVRHVESVVKELSLAHHGEGR